MPEVQIIGNRVLTSAAVAAASAAAVARDAALSAQVAAEAAAAAAAGASDAGVAALVGSGPLTSAALSSTYVTPKNAGLGSGWVFDGDSITICNTATNADGSQSYLGSWVQEVVRLSQGRIKLLHNSAVAGRNTVNAIAQFDSRVAPYTPDVVVYEEITHSIDDGLTSAQYLALLDQYLAKVQGIGARLVVTSGFPNDTKAATIATWDRALVEWCETNRVVYVPIHTLADPDGTWQSGWSSDGTHPYSLSPAWAEIGGLFWDAVSPLLSSGCVTPQASIQGEGLFANGFLTTIGTGITGRVATLSAASTTGTLAAGTYEYRVIPAGTYLGKGPDSAAKDVSITLGATGGVVLTFTLSGSSGNRVIYRKDPGSSTFKYLAYTSSTSTYTDSGATTPTYDWVSGDHSIPASGMGNSGSAAGPRISQWGAVLQSEAGVRGNFLRCVGTHAGGTFTYTFDIPFEGTEVELSLRMRWHFNTDYPTALPGIRIRHRSSSAELRSDAIFAQHAPNDEWALVYWRGPVASGTTILRLSFELNGTKGIDYFDVAEIRAADVS